MRDRKLPARDVSVPAFIYGTAWKEDRTSELTLQALGAGFRAIDTANQRRHYLEAAVGQAVQEFVAAGGCTREALFLQTKFTFVDGQDHRLPYDLGADFATQVRQSFESSLEHLKTSTIDSYVLHGPSSSRGLSQADREVWSAMESLVCDGGVRLLGVSNVSLDQLARLIGITTVPIAFVQNRCYARTGWDRGVRALCRDHGIVYQGFSLLTANARELESPALRKIAERHECSLAQLVFRYAIEVGMLPLTGSSDAAHLREDLACVEIELSAEEIDVIDRIGG